MILCDIGNSFLHFYHRGKIWKEIATELTQKDSNEVIFYISVNEDSTKALLYSHPKCFDLTPYLTLDTAYKGLGIDRIAACYSIEEGAIIDAGSAITVDIMQDGIHLGGFIMPGIAQYKKMFSHIAVLNCEMNLGIDLEAFPQNTKDALSFGILKSIFLTIQNTARNKKLYFTGGDGKFLSRYFNHAIYDDTLVFKGMQKSIAKHIASKGIKL
ncbi:MAG: type III pantothenate kinase [Helicobacter sp.]|nr:type III pantothenate kinase [Helicobacter sp.]